MAGYVYLGSDPMYFFYTDYAWYYDFEDEDEDDAEDD